MLFPPSLINRSRLPCPLVASLRLSLPPNSASWVPPSLVGVHLEPTPDSFLRPCTFSLLRRRSGRPSAAWYNLCDFLRASPTISWRFQPPPAAALHLCVSHPRHPPPSSLSIVVHFPRNHQPSSLSSSTSSDLLARSPHRFLRLPRHSISRRFYCRRRRRSSSLSPELGPPLSSSHLSPELGPPLSYSRLSPELGPQFSSSRSSPVGTLVFVSFASFVVWGSRQSV